MRNGNYELVVAPEEYPGKKYRGRYCYEHHLVYWQHTGVVPAKDEVVHHKNDNTRDNRFENLELKKRRRHSAEHSRAHGKKMVLLQCPTCGIIFRKEHRQTHLVKKSQFTTCSRSCATFLSGTYFGRSKAKIPDDVQERINNNVIKVFRVFPGS